MISGHPIYSQALESTDPAGALAREDVGSKIYGPPLTECTTAGTDSFSPQTTPQLWKLEGFSALVTSAEDGEEQLGRTETLGRQNSIYAGGHPSVNLSCTANGTSVGWGRGRPKETWQYLGFS